MAHTMNPMAKSILRPFEPNKLKTDADGNKVDDEDDGLEGGLAMEELRAELQDLEENVLCEGDDVEGLVNVLDEMTDVEKEEWAEAVMPIRKALVKVRKSSIVYDWQSRNCLIRRFSFLLLRKSCRIDFNCFRLVGSMLTELFAGPPCLLQNYKLTHSPSPCLVKTYSWDSV